MPTHVEQQRFREEVRRLSQSLGGGTLEAAQYLMNGNEYGMNAGVPCDNCDKAGFTCRIYKPGFRLTGFRCAACRLFRGKCDVAAKNGGSVHKFINAPPMRSDSGRREMQKDAHDMSSDSHKERPEIAEQKEGVHGGEDSGLPTPVEDDLPITAEAQHSQIPPTAPVVPSSMLQDSPAASTTNFQDTLSVDRADLIDPQQTEDENTFIANLDNVPRIRNPQLAPLVPSFMIPDSTVSESSRLPTTVNPRDISIEVTTSKPRTSLSMSDDPYALLAEHRKKNLDKYGLDVEN